MSWGLNSRLDNLQAAILDYRLEATTRDRAAAGDWRGCIRLGCSPIWRRSSLPPGPDGTPDHFDVFQNYEIEARIATSCARF